MATPKTVQYWAGAWQQHGSDLPAHYTRNADCRPRQQYVVRQVLSAQPRTILDVGCLDGRLIARLRRHHYAGRYWGVDVTPRYVARAALQHPDSFSVADARRLPFADRSFDVVVLTNVIQHLGAPRRAILEAQRVAKTRIVLSSYGTDGVTEARHRAPFCCFWYARQDVEQYFEAPWHVQEFREFPIARGSRRAVYYWTLDSGECG